MPESRFWNSYPCDIAGEESGRMAKPFEWSLVSLPWMSHGYELLSTHFKLLKPMLPLIGVI